MSRRVLGMREALRPQPKLSDEKMDALALRAKTGATDREELTTHCMGLIVSEARRCRNTLGEDGFGEASVAFLEAIDSYNPARGSFRGWAVYVMRCDLSDATRKEKNYRGRASAGEKMLSFAEDLHAARLQAPADPTEIPELLTAAVCDGRLTERQAKILVMRAQGAEPDEIMATLSISRRTYFRELKAAKAALGG